ncbi:hypothetical protein AZH43_17315 [Acinetobacter pragensis]|uniref:Uncharacterized protein n=1 Tax=Acinetobacter pragensis TaxID=1806892 RepID=A0A151XYA3_9GAMM|nr:hypothetical protein AZH43_17315 [Acinetobacter pragensis]
MISEQEVRILQEEVLRSDLKKLNGSFNNMLQLFRKIFCMHIYEYEQMEEIGAHKECRKCGVMK